MSSCRDHSKQISTAQATPIKEGGTDTGGSNDFMNRPLESYIIDVESLQEYQEYIAPLMSRLDQKLPRLSSTLRNSLKNRTWYLVPGALNALPNYNIAFPVSNETEQFALHSEKAVWLSLEKRGQYTNSKDLATHVLHEIVMAVKVDGNLKRRKVTKKSIVTEAEYDQIRTITKILMDDLDSYSAKDLDLLLKSNKFYNSGDTLDLIRMHPYENIPLGNADFTSTEEFFAYADSIRFAKSYKRYGLPEPDMSKVEDFCTYELTKGGLKVTTLDQNGNGAQTKTLEFSERVDFKNKSSRVSEKFITQSRASDNKDLAHMAHLYYLDNELLFIEIYEVYRDQFTNEWSHYSIPNDYIMCVNRSLQ